jgi:hypothetical protein
MFHRHKWIETARVKMPAMMPDNGMEMRATGTLAYELIQLTKERTAVHLRCETCGDVASRILDGWEEGRDA